MSTVSSDRHKTFYYSATKSLCCFVPVTCLLLAPGLLWLLYYNLVTPATGHMKGNLGPLFLQIWCFMYFFLKERYISELSQPANLKVS